MSWTDAGKLSEELRAKKVPIVGVGLGVKEPGSTQFAATYIPSGDHFIVIHWKRKPSQEEREQAISIVQEGSPERIDLERIVDSATSEYPPDGPSESPDLSPVMGYYWPDIWAEGKPGVLQLESDSIHDLVCSTKITQDIRVKVFRLGFFVFDFSNWKDPLSQKKGTRDETNRLVKQKMRRVAVFNAHLLCLYKAIWEIQEFAMWKTLISHQDVISMNNFDDPFSNMAAGRFGTLMDIAHRPSLDHPSTDISHPVGAAEIRWLRAYYSRIVVSQAALDRSFELLNSILDHASEHSLMNAETLSFSCKAFEDHNYNLCLITAWGIIEKLLKLLWDRYINENRKNMVDLNGEKTLLINADRAKLLRDGNHFTASVITEVLTCMERLPFTFYKSLNEVRNARNKWMHELRPVQSDIAYQGLKLAQDLLRHVDGFDFTIPVGGGLVL